MKLLLAPWFRPVHHRGFTYLLANESWHALHLCGLTLVSKLLLEAIIVRNDGLGVYERLGICLSRCSLRVKLFPQYVQKIIVTARTEKS